MVSILASEASRTRSNRVSAARLHRQMVRPISAKDVYSVRILVVSPRSAPLSVDRDVLARVLSSLLLYMWRINVRGLY